MQDNRYPNEIVLIAGVEQMKQVEHCSRCHDEMIAMSITHYVVQCLCDTGSKTHYCLFISESKDRAKLQQVHHCWVINGSVRDRFLAIGWGLLLCFRLDRYYHGGGIVW